ncbi:Lysosome membrane protein 2 [Chionoecetes opilio]|uniref:Lysosome membrane protein 2 n=1 Tax=Chionoecetes opilio TaxID=41210 RepID=A0A8J5D0B2_CHIOP|nr:Lysosome membrane protein 2 [Chionoecetes opilio]
MLVIREDAATFEAFVTPPIPIYMQFWLFNVSNPEEIRYTGAKPILQEIGPYTYEEVREKYSFEWSPELGTVSYLQNKSYIFREDLSNGLKESDFVTSVNVLMVIASRLFAHRTDLVSRTIWTQMEKAMDLFEPHRAGEILFYGYQLPRFDFDYSGLDEICEKLGQDCGMLNATNGFSGTIADILAAGGVDVPQKLEDNALGFLLGVNNTNDKRYEVRTGEQGMDDFLRIVTWNGTDSLNYWQGPEAHYCNMINGSDGTQYPPRLSRQSILRLYTSELCSVSLYLTYESDGYVHGIPVYRFVPPREVLEDPLVNHDNLCYCVPDTSYCLGAGMLNLETCLGACV